MAHHNTTDASPGDSFGPKEFWLDGGTVLTGCPDCHAPMAIRLWLMVADCWQCGTSVELTEEQERAIQRLLKSQVVGAARPPSSEPKSPTVPLPPATAQAPSRTAAPEPAATNVRAAVPRTWTQPPQPTAAAQPATDARRPVTGRRNARPDRIPIAKLVRSFLRDLPAWLMSLLWHIALLALLAFLHRQPAAESEPIVLSLAVAQDRVPRDQPAIIDTLTEQFDLPIPEEMDVDNARDREVLLRADQDARTLRLEPDAETPYLPQLETVQAVIRTGREDLRTLATRDPRLRREILKQEGGTTLTEAAVARGLRWLAGQQRDNGSWRLTGRHTEMAGTALALLPFLGAGQTDRVGQYQDNVRNGLDYLLKRQSPDGALRGDVPDQFVMYTHGQATIVLCEAYAMTRDETLRGAAQRATDYIVRAQYPRGGWRYLPRDETPPDQRRGDTSVLGWQLMALQSARAAGLEVPAAVWDLAEQYLDSVTDPNGYRYAYQEDGSPTETMTAEALLCRMYLGWRRNHPQLQATVDYLTQDEHRPRRDTPNIYYWYYATQSLHHMGGGAWKRWNQDMRNVLVETQETRGRHSGSWAPRGPHSNIGGRVYMTSLAVCTLEVYYRHAPIFRQIDL